MNLSSKTIRLRLITKEDASFVLSLRANDTYNAYLSAVFPHMNEKQAWLAQYQAAEAAGKEFCFIIERLDGTACGTVRVFDLKGDSFSWGSWILNQDKTLYAAIESALLVYRFGFEHLGCNQSHFAVMTDNARVLSFHEKMGAKKAGEDALDSFYTIDKNSVYAYQSRMRKIVA